MVDITTLHNFLIKAHEIFPVKGNVHHSITLSDVDENALQVNIIVEELKQFWYVRLETDDEWINATDTLNEVKDATLLVINKTEDES